jgi:hypothetical protein
VVLADVGLYRVLGVESPVTVGAGDGLTPHVLALDMALQAMSVLDFLGSIL